MNSELRQSLQYQRTIATAIAVIGAAGAAGLYFYFPADASYACGWALGVVAGIAIFRHRAATVLSLFDKPQEEWARISIKSSLTAYAITIAVVVAAMYIDQLNPYAALGGILLERLVLRADGWLRPNALAPAEDAAIVGEGEA